MKKYLTVLTQLPMQQLQTGWGNYMTTIISGLFQASEMQLQCTIQKNYSIVNIIRTLVLYGIKIKIHCNYNK